MPARRLNPDQIKWEVLWRLKRRGCWGARYTPRDAIVSWLTRTIKDNGAKVNKVIDELIKKELIIKQKKGKTISLNPRLKKEIDMTLEA